MSKRWLVFDGDYMGHRAFHSTGELTHGGQFTGVIYGVIRDIAGLMDTFQTRRVAVCFDHGRGLRLDLLPGYKSTRRKKRRAMSDEDKELYREMKKQIRELRDGLLQELGFQNVYFQKGYEADDMIAAFARQMSKTDDITIVGNDSDLWQLLGERVFVMNPTTGKTMTHLGLKEIYGVWPKDWPMVKAIAGCGTDDVPGIRGVGEKTAAAYMAGTLNPKSAKYDLIHKQGVVAMAQNLPIVKLPLKGCRKNFIAKRTVECSARNWRRTLKRYGINSVGLPAVLNG